MKKDFLQDSKGNKSSKRLWGSILLTFGLVFSTILFVFSLLAGAADPATAISIINIFLFAGGSLLGVGVFEKGIKHRNGK